MRILTLLPGHAVGGAERVAAAICSDLQRRGHDIIFGSSYNERLQRLVPDAPVRVIALHPGRKWKAGRALFDLHRICTEWRPDVIYTHHRWPTVLAHQVRSFRRIPLVYHCHSLVSQRLGTYWGDLTIAVSHAVARHLQQLGVRSEQIRLVYPGIERVRSSPEERRHAEKVIAASFGVRPPRFAVVVSRFDEGKTYSRLIEALRTVPDIAVLFVGDGALRAELARLADGRGVGNRVAFAGWVDDPVPFYALADFSILLSDAEGLPRSALESLAQSCPMIASNVGGVSEVIEPDGGGILIEPGDEGALAAALQALWHDADMRRRLGATGRRVVLRRFSHERAVDEVSAVLEEATIDR